jgi:two-component system sensor histidine kinase VicK
MANARQVRGPDGQVLGAIATIRDVTEQRELERQRSLLLSAMMHDLKSPLATIKGISQLIHRRILRAHEIPEETRETLVDELGSVDQKVSQMARLIDDLVESGHRALAPALQEMDLVALVRALSSQMNHSEQNHTIRLETTLSELVGEWDCDRLERALDNVLRNAVKYSPAGGAVRVGVERARENGREEAVITVEDRGIGIPKSDQARIFERFYRAGNATEVASGTGIGLAAVHQTVESHGGTIGIESVEGEGTTVRIRLPVKPS